MALDYFFLITLNPAVWKWNLDSLEAEVATRELEDGLEHVQALTTLVSASAHAARFEAEEGTRESSRRQAQLDALR